jgi:4-hydroxybenzoate polyprenyltransferase
MALFRVSNLPTVWSNVLAAALLCGAPFSPIALISLMFSLSLFYCGGMALNDVCDSEVDRQQRASRPIPAGSISRRDAFLAAVLLFSAAFALLLTLPHYAAGVCAGVVLVACILLYDLFHKANPLSVLVMAACRSMVYVVSGFALAGAVNHALLGIGGLQFVYIVIISLTARYENTRTDAFPFPLIPIMLAGICLLDGIYLAVTLSWFWLLAGIGWTALTMLGQRYVRGD